MSTALVEFLGYISDFSRSYLLSMFLSFDWVGK